MKVTLTFDLPEDASEYQSAIAGDDYRSVLDEIDEWLRQKVKYPSEKQTDEETDCYRKAREHLSKLLNEREL
jgi:hypothetical protein